MHLSQIIINVCKKNVMKYIQWQKYNRSLRGLIRIYYIKSFDIKNLKFLIRCYSLNKY